MFTLHHQFTFITATIRLGIKHEADTWLHHHHYQNCYSHIHREGAFQYAHHSLTNQRKEHPNQVEWKSIQASLFIILFGVDALSNRTREQYLNASLPNEMVVNEGKSILQFILTPITLEHNNRTIQERIVTNRDRRESGAVYSSSQHSFHHSQTQAMNAS